MPRDTLRRRIHVIVASPTFETIEVLVIEIPFSMSKNEFAREMEKFLAEMSEFTGQPMSWQDLPDVIELLPPPFRFIPVEDRAVLFKVAQEP